MGMRGYGGYGAFGGGWWMMFLWPIFWLLIPAGIILLVRYLWPSVSREQPPWREQGSSALEILRERYARGEIEQEEFLRRKQELR